MSRTAVAFAALLLLSPAVGACDDEGKSEADTRGLEDAPADTARDSVDGADANGPDALVTYTEERARCLEREPNRLPLFGDLHVHTRLSFDAWIEGTRPGPAEAYQFAKGEPLAIAPLDANQMGTQTLQLDRPLDFAAVTDHAEYLGEIETCTEPSASGYDHPRCVAFRDGETQSIADFGTQLTNDEPSRLDLCDSIDCGLAADAVWSDIQAAAEVAYDRTETCEFTSFVGYEWTGNTAGRNLHRNVIFRNDKVPSRPISYFEEPTPQGLWRALESDCHEGIDGCEVLAIPHNSNLSNGAMFIADYPESGSEAEQAAFRGRMEPLMEIFQHKGNSECNNGFAGILGEPDELCAVEAIRPVPFDDCGEDLGALGIRGAGCVSKYDYFRTTLLAGLEEEARLGENPFRLGVIASTDTHNATPGYTSEDNFLGHTGVAEGIVEERFSDNHLAPFGIVANPGGLAGVWAVENSRDAIYDALQRRETWGTSGTRIVPRFFGAWSLDGDLCGGDLVAEGYAQGVPMGSTLPARAGESGPTFALQALRDPSGLAEPLQQVQVIKGWRNGDGSLEYAVHTIAGDADNGASVDLSTCETSGPGSQSLCGVWTDPDFDPAVPSFYYMRVVENPRCRWSQLQCLSIAPAERPAACDDPTVPGEIQEMAWTSPIWYAP